MVNTLDYKITPAGDVDVILCTDSFAGIKIYESGNTAPVYVSGSISGICTTVTASASYFKQGTGYSVCLVYYGTSTAIIPCISFTYTGPPPPLLSITNLSASPTTPNPGDLVTVTLDTTFTGSPDAVRANIMYGSTYLFGNCHGWETGSCTNIPEGGTWSVSGSFTIGTTAATITAYTEHWNGSAFVTDQTRTLTITLGGGGEVTGYACSDCTKQITCPSGTTCYLTPSECTTRCATGTGNYSCIDGCTTPTTCTPGVTSGCYASQIECTAKCSSQMCFFGSCYDKNTVIMAVGGLFAFMMLMSVTQRS